MHSIVVQHRAGLVWRGKEPRRELIASRGACDGTVSPKYDRAKLLQISDLAPVERDAPRQHVRECHAQAGECPSVATAAMQIVQITVTVHLIRLLRLRAAFAGF